MKLNFDTKAPLRWTEEAKAALLDGDPRARHFTSFSGIPIEAVPELYKHRLGDR